MNEFDLPLCMQAGWDPTTPGREYVEKTLSEWETEDYIPTKDELGELEWEE